MYKIPTGEIVYRMPGSVPDMKVWGQPASPEVKKKHKKKSCKISICLLYMLYCAPMLFTCIKVLNRLIVKGGLCM
jgi:hypothetical protein